MTQETVNTQGPAPGRRRGRIVRVAASAVVALVVVQVVFGWLPGVPRRPGPLRGQVMGSVSVALEAGAAGVFWGALELHNPTGHPITLDSVALEGNLGDLVPSAGPYLWDEDRGTIGEVGSWQLPLPGDRWAVPPRHDVGGYRIGPQGGDETVEIAYEFPVPARSTTLTGVTVRYHAGVFAYRRTFSGSLTLAVG